MNTGSKRKIEEGHEEEKHSKKVKTESTTLLNAGQPVSQVLEISERKMERDWFKKFVNSGLMYLHASAYSEFWRYLDHYNDKISEDDFSLYYFYQAINEFIRFMIADRKKRIDAGETENMSDDISEEDYYYEELSGLPALENTLVDLIADIINESDSEDIRNAGKNDLSVEEYIKLFESIDNLERSKVVYIDNPDFRYGAENPKKVCDIPGSSRLLELHQSGQHIYEHFKSECDDLKGQTVNISIAHLSFVVSDKPHKKGGDHKRTLVSMPIVDRSKMLANITNFSSDEAKKAKSIAARSDAAINIMLHNNPLRTDIVEQDEMNAKLADPRSAALAFHHSEQALAEYLKTYNAWNDIIVFLKSKNIMPGHKVYAVVLDLYTTRDCCKNCSQAMLGIQNPESNEFLSWLNYILKSEGYVISDKTTTKLSVQKRGEYTKAKDPGVRMVVRAIYNEPYEVDKRPEDRARAQSPISSIDTDMRYISNKLFMTKPSKLKQLDAKRTNEVKDKGQTGSTQLPHGYTIFSSRKPTKDMQTAVKQIPKTATQTTLPFGSFPPFRPSGSSTS